MHELYEGQKFKNFQCFVKFFLTKKSAQHDYNNICKFQLEALIFSMFLINQVYTFFLSLKLIPATMNMYIVVTIQQANLYECFVHSFHIVKGLNAKHINGKNEIELKLQTDR